MQSPARFLEVMRARLKKIEDEVNKLWMSDEAAPLHLSGFVNKPNFKCWA